MPRALFFSSVDNNQFYIYLTKHFRYSVVLTRQLAGSEVSEFGAKLHFAN